ncbi:MAG TPA: hypothetical protein VN749_19005 [Candidatus Eisenbacteria bacterium]|nr:hypothetical protein [Candidatus Eisenbacteria bacterium]
MRAVAQSMTHIAKAAVHIAGASRSAGVALAVALSTLIVPATGAQQQGPLPPPTSSGSSGSPGMTSTGAPNAAARSEVHDESEITSTPPAIPAEQIIARFSQHESEFRDERANYAYTQTFVFQTLDSDDVADGEYRLVTDVGFTSEGKRYDHDTYAPVSTITRLQFTQQDLDDLRNIQPFVLTAEELPKYNVTYVGRQTVDDLRTYIFDVAPKKIEKDQRYFQGRVWVDEKDLQIVKSSGKAVPDIIKKNNENIFPHFTTYRENIAGPYWFPTYTHADDVLAFRAGGVHIRFTVKYANYKRFGSTHKLGTPVEIKQ